MFRNKFQTPSPKVREPDFLRFGLPELLLITPRHKTNTCRDNFLGNYFWGEYMRGLYSHSREYCIIQDNLFEEGISTFLRNSWGNPFRCEYRKKSWRIVYVLVSYQGTATTFQRMKRDQKKDSSLGPVLETEAQRRTFGSRPVPVGWGSST